MSSHLVGVVCCSYIYDSAVGREYPSYKDYKYGVEDLFIQLLASSKFRTHVSIVVVVVVIVVVVVVVV